MTSAEHYRVVERALLELISSITTLESSDREEVCHFLNVGEYGLALETLIGIVDEKKINTPVETLNEALRLADLMGLRDSPMIPYLQRKLQKA